MTNEQLIQTVKEAMRNDSVLNKGMVEMLCNALVAVTEQCDALVVGSVALKKFGETLFEMREGLNDSGTGIQGEHETVCQQVALDAAMDAFDEIKTPATDAFLAEVRAQGVEMFADHILCPDLDGTIREFAAKLRKGAAL